MREMRIAIHYDNSYIYVPLPNKEARADMFQHYLTPEIAPDLPYGMLAENTEGYSGSDIRLICKESAMFPLRRLGKDRKRDRTARK